ncbi:MAG: redoxin domain-containing protein, partial [Proteobacteria bacterium]|nr:redoxin domain-containing protein [Pseudomonadota bacterium]
MADLKAGDIAPAFDLPDEDGNEVSLKDLKGKWVIFYFYPRDSTPGCTVEANEFTAELDAFEKLGAVILGVSR